MGEFPHFKNSSSKERLVTCGEWALKLVSEFDFFSADPESIKHAETPYFLKVSKIRESIYVSEGVCSLKAYKEWRNTLY